MKFFKIFSHDKLFLAKIILTSILIAAGVTSFYFAYNIKLELDSITSNKIEVDSAIQQKLKETTSNFIKELFFGVGLIVLSGISLKSMFFKSKDKKKEDETVPKSNIQINLATKAKKHVFFYVILLPIIHGVLLLFGANILNFVNSTSSTTISDYNTYVMITALPFLAITSIFYLSKLRKHNSKEYFELQGYDYVVTERTILEKIKKTGIIILIATLTILIAYGYIDQTPKPRTILSTFELIMFSVAYANFEILAFSYYKIKEQEKKKNFKLFLASGFFKKALESEEKPKVKYLTSGLSWYSFFFRKTHKLFIGDIDKICLILLSKKSNSALIPKLIQNFESDDEYAAINEIANLMEVKTGDLFPKYTTFTKLKEWSELIGVIVGLAQAAWAVIIYLIISNKSA